MNCKDCLHYSVCQYRRGHEMFPTGYPCSTFADRSEWVHLPCKVGDIVYYFDGAYYLKNKNNWEVKPIKVTEFSTKIGRSG